MEQNHIFCYRENGTVMWDAIKSCRILLLLLKNWFGPWCFWIECPNVVRPLRSVHILFKKFIFQDFMYVHFTCLMVCRLPFDWKNPFGYLIAASFQYTVAVHAAIFLTCISTLGLGAFLFTIAVNKVCTQNSLVICKKAKYRKSQRHVLRRLLEFVQFHSSVKQLSF